ncbi:MAG: ATP-binding protein [Candidatus Cloacimonetes bacterium]|nr:ATP-binding protein [Candidatus Cloacimonadota bacterium]
MTKKELPIGVSDFKKIIIDDLYFVDKSMFIKDVVGTGTMVLLYPRPRRFGKTLNLSMLKYFYDCNEDNSQLFDDLEISKEEKIMKKQGKYPVIFITLKDIKAETLELCFEKIYSEISSLYSSHRKLLNESFMSKWDIEYFESILSKKGNYADFTASLKNLSQYLYEHYKINPVILIDEYDTPIHSGYYNGYYKEIVSFMQGFLGGALKDNVYLEKGVLTGILRVAKESIFSDLNNIRVLTILNQESANRFGFTEDEVGILLKESGSILNLSEIKNMYNGYNFGGIDIYNPWSILNSLQEKNFGHYWANSSGNNLIKTMCQEADESVKEDLEILLQGGKIKKYIKDSIIFQELQSDQNAIWNFFLMCGYLRYDDYILNVERGDTNADISIPNKEIFTLFNTTIVPNWFRKTEKTDELINLATLLVDGDFEEFKKEFIQYCQESFSYFDVSGQEPEKFYHAFVLGMITCLRDRYLIKSNRETGYGRSDLMLIPYNLPPHSQARDFPPHLWGGQGGANKGIIFEFKKLNEARGETFEKAFRNGKRQLLEKQYDIEMKGYGIEKITYIIAVFKGKEVMLESF